ncbi:MAG: NADH:ubiquinone reductase (Na(+)-transporting) subunit E [Weeksellaceae bacterium]|nr:NADH:ubiquinone reductase (Na(+)-transporting) subunit E [Weeksellaceae bacterium]
MLEHIELFFKSVFINNMVFATFLGMCSFLAVSKKVSTAVGLGAAVIFVMMITLPLNWLLDQFVLQEGALSWLSPALADVDLSFLTFILFIATIATMVQLVEIVVEKFAPALYNSLGIFLPLIAVNCAILGGALFMQARDIPTIGQAFNYGFSSGLGFFLAILSLAAIREKIRYSHIPAPLRGLGITFITTGLMAIGFMSFGGMLTTSDAEMPVDGMSAQAQPATQPETTVETTEATESADASTAQVSSTDITTAAISAEHKTNINIQKTSQP